MATVLIALGGNLATAIGGPEATLRAASARIAARIGPLLAMSRIWQSPAFPSGSGPDYANAALALHSGAAPADLLAALHGIEADFGRERQGRWGARVLDLDLLAVGDRILPDPAVQAAWRALSPEDQARRAPEELILPHPRLQDRTFVLVPLAEIAPGWCHPALHLTVAEMLAALPAADVAALAPIP